MPIVYYRLKPDKQLMEHLTKHAHIGQEVMIRIRIPFSDADKEDKEGKATWERLEIHNAKVQRKEKGT